METSLTRIVRFSAMHRYFRPEWSEERNRATFGSSAEAPGHGHEYQCAVTVSGSPDPLTGMIIDLGLLDRVLADEVFVPLHQKHFNLDVATFAYGKQVPTGERVAEYLFGRIAARLPANVRLQRVRVQEDETLYAECSAAT